MPTNDINQVSFLPLFKQRDAASWVITHAKNYVVVKKVKMYILYVYFSCVPICISLFKSLNKPHIPHSYTLGTMSVIFGYGCWVNLNEFKNPNSHF